MPKTLYPGHEATLGYTVNDDGVHLRCECGADIPLGFDATPQDAVDAHAAHVADPAWHVHEYDPHWEYDPVTRRRKRFCACGSFKTWPRGEVEDA